MLDIIEQYIALRKKERDRIEKFDERIENTEAYLKRLKARRYKLPESSWIDGIVKPLAERLSEMVNMPYEIYGPFGLSCETSLYFRKDMSKSICNQPTMSITLVPHDLKYAISYKTGEKTQKYAPNTIGDINGFNDITKPLPDNYEEIVAIVKKNYHDPQEKVKMVMKRI